MDKGGTDLTALLGPWGLTVGCIIAIGWLVKQWQKERDLNKELSQKLLDTTIQLLPLMTKFKEWMEDKA